MKISAAVTCFCFLYITLQPSCLKAERISTLFTKKNEQYKGSLPDYSFYRVPLRLHWKVVRRLLSGDRFKVRIEGTRYEGRVRRFLKNTSATAAYYGATKNLGRVNGALFRGGEKVGYFSLSANLDAHSNQSNLYGLFNFSSGYSYSVLRDEEKNYVLQKNIASKLGGCIIEGADSITNAQLLANRPAFLPLAASSNTKAVIDLLVIYSPESRLAAGNAEVLEAEITSAVALANQAYENSQIFIELRLIGVAETLQAEIGETRADLESLKGKTDGRYDETHSLRDILNADIVIMITSKIVDNICGRANLMSALSPSFESLAFGIVVRSCFSNQTLTHEIGHIQGAEHDTANSFLRTIEPFAHGHRFIGDDSIQYRTIMALSPGKRIVHFSNPDIIFAGQTIGLAGKADNASLLNLTALTISAFRGVPVSPSPTHTSTPTVSLTPTSTTSPTLTPTASPTAVSPSTPTPTTSPDNTHTPTLTPTSTATQVHTPTFTPTQTPTTAPTATPTPQLPDLTLRTLALPISKKEGAKLLVKTFVTNQGSLGAAKIMIEFYLSTDNLFNKRTDKFLSKTILNNIDSAVTLKVSTRIRVPKAVKAGKYFFLAVLDPDNTVIEFDENNNIAMAEKQIQITK